MIWYDTTRHDTIRYMTYYDMIWWYDDMMGLDGMGWDVTWHDMTWHDMTWLIWYYMIWYDMVWYGMVWYGTVRYDTVRYDTIRYDTTRHDTIYDVLWYDMIWYDMNLKMISAKLKWFSRCHMLDNVCKPEHTSMPRTMHHHLLNCLGDFGHRTILFRIMNSIFFTTEHFRKWFMYTAVANCSCAHTGFIVVYYFNQKNNKFPLVSASAVRHSSRYIIRYLFDFIEFYCMVLDYMVSYNTISYYAMLCYIVLLNDHGSKSLSYLSYLHSSFEQCSFPQFISLCDPRQMQNSTHTHSLSLSLSLSLYIYIYIYTCFTYNAGGHRDCPGGNLIMIEVPPCQGYLVCDFWITRSVILLSKWRVG